MESATLLLGGVGLSDSIPLVPERMAASSWEGMLVNDGDNREGYISSVDTVVVITDAFCTANNSEISS